MKRSVYQWPKREAWWIAVITLIAILLLIRLNPLGQKQATHSSHFIGHSDVITALVVSSDGKTLISGSKDEKVKVWDIATKTCLQTITTYGPDKFFNLAVTSISFSPDGRFFTLLSEVEGRAQVWQTSGYTQLSKINYFVRLRSSLFSPNNRAVFVMLLMERLACGMLAQELDAGVFRWVRIEA